MSSLKEQLMKKKAAIQAASGRRENTTKPKQGKSRFRILPSWRGLEDRQFYHEFGTHFIKDQAGAMKAVYVCVDKTYGKPCSICEGIVSGMNAAVDDDIKKALSDAKAGGRILMNAIAVDGDKETPVILDLTPTTFDKVLDIAIDNVDEHDDDFNIVTDKDNGVDIIITRSGTGLNTEYSVLPALKGSKPVPKSVLDKMHDLDEYVSQEYEAGLNKAIGAVSSVSGMLPSPSSPSVAAIGEDAAFDKDVPDFVSAPRAEKEDKPKDADGAIDGEYEEVDEPPPAKKEDLSDISDDELNSLLDELD